MDGRGGSYKGNPNQSDGEGEDASDGNQDDASRGIEEGDEKDSISERDEVIDEEKKNDDLGGIHRGLNTGNGLKNSSGINSSKSQSKKSQNFKISSRGIGQPLRGNSGQKLMKTREEGSEEDLNVDAELEDMDFEVPSDEENEKSLRNSEKHKSNAQKSVQFKLEKNTSFRSHFGVPLVSAKQETIQASIGRRIADDNFAIPLSGAGQSNALQKSKVPVKVKFADEASSSKSSSRRSSHLGSISGSLNSGIIEERAKKEYDRFYPIFKQVFKLRALQAKGYKANPQDFFVAYLNGMKEADQKREAEQKAKNQEFFEMVRKVMEEQDKRTQSLLERMQELQEERREQVEERIAKVGQFMLADYKKGKEEAKVTSRHRESKANQNFQFLQQLGYKPNAMMKNSYLK